ncbi:MAG: SUMF1/EgtB/PvdO family nonheme iron enzyme [Dehalococcoidia bacterium]|nr:SUMF1/EgtB/PvdO family nonheme iron enzyme [Dehalococcoidia bacterium]
MVLIPKGKFLYSKEKQEKNIDYDYFMDKFPVTNQRYAEFIKAGCYTEKEYWSNQGWAWREIDKITKPEFWNDNKWNQPDYPVVGVSWYEADAYCRWLSKETGQNYRLPTEEEWEKAARGNNGREYPWGNEFDKAKCNTSESGIGGTTEVTRYLKGASPYDCQDMAGNVWEWTKTQYNTSKPLDDFKTLHSLDEVPVLRGGSWGSNQGFARCAYRLGRTPGYLGFDIGFRCSRTQK